MARVDQIDGGYAWFVLLNGIFNIFLSEGFAYSLTLYKKPLKEELNATESEMNYMIPILFFLHLFASGFFIRLKMFISIRKILFGCTILTSVSFMIASIQTSYFMVFIFMIVFPGFFTSGEFIASVETVNSYFVKYKGIALTLSNAGLAVGVFFYPYFIDYFMFNYNWRVSLFFLGLFHLNQLIPTAAFIRASLWRRLAIETNEVDEPIEKRFVLVLVEKENVFRANQLKYIYNLPNEKWSKDQLKIDADAQRLHISGEYDYITFNENITLREKINRRIRLLTDKDLFYREFIITRETFLVNISLAIFILSNFTILNSLSPYYEELDFKTESIVQFNLYMGIFSLCARLGVTVSLIFLSRLEANQMFLIAGISMVLTATCLYTNESHLGQLFSNILFGLFSTTPTSYVNVVLIEMAGTDVLMKAITQNTIWQSLGFLLTPFVSNLIFKYIHESSKRFYICSGMYVMVVLLLLPVVYSRLRVRSKESKVSVSINKLESIVYDF